MSVYVVAEAGSNHDGELGQAYALIDEAARAGADAIKFQCLPNFPQEWMKPLMEYARSQKLDCFATPFDPDAVRFLADLGVPYIKIASVEMVYDDLLEAVAATGMRVLLSTGMAAMDEVYHAVRVLEAGGCYVIPLQCTVCYPTPPDQVNLRAMVTMGEDIHGLFGLSDHTLGTAIPIAAAALGATVIEKHITLEPDRCADPRGPDHPFALQPAEFRQMVEGIRQVEQALGRVYKNGPVNGEPIGLRGRRLTWTS